MHRARTYCARRRHLRRGPAVMSFSRPASTCSFITPPPQLWKMSGASPDCITVVNLVLKASFSRTVISMLTFGWAAM